MNRLAFKELSTKEAFSFSIKLKHKYTGSLFEWAGWTATVSIAYRDRPATALLTGSSSGSYVTLPSDGILEASFPAPHGLCSGQYLVGLLLENGTPSDTVQQFIGSLPVTEGV
jgi:hypothetical protein